MKLLVIGHGEHGKDTACKIINRLTGLKFISSSEVAVNVGEIWEVISAARPEYDGNRYLAYSMRREDRLLWGNTIRLYNTPDKTALCKRILLDNDIYNGMRCDEEYLACKKLFNAVLWVDATIRVSKNDPSMKIPFNPREMIFINNNYTTRELEAELKSALRYVRK